MIISQKIDYVIPYVDGSDPEWLALYLKNKNLNENAKNEEEVKKRFSPNILFKYQFRGIEKFMPWIGSIHLLVQSYSQVPKWLDQSKVHVVLHDEFMPASCLPTYNSSTFECFLHKIPDLAVRFIYANDDTYVTGPLNESDFFDGVMPLNSYVRRFVNPYHNESFQRMNMKITEFISKELGIPYVPNTMCLPHHVQKAMNKIIYKQIFDKYEDYIMSKATMFRTDDNLSQAFFTMYYMLSTKLKYRKTIPFHRFDVFTGFKRLIDFFDKTPPEEFPPLLCINNNDNDKDIAIMCKFDKMFPAKSKYEI